MSQAFPAVVTTFPVEDLEFAAAWAARVPGWGGWLLTVEDASWGEMVSVAPPGSHEPVFMIAHSEDGQGVDVHRSSGVIAKVGDLRAALLLLCPLPTDVLDAIA